MVSPPLSITALDLGSQPGDVAANAAAAAAQIRNAHADLVLFPELFLSAYDLEIGPGCAVEAGDERLREIGEACSETGRRALISAPLSPGPNIGILFADRDGSISVVYRKQHLDPPEREAFELGDGGGLLDLDGWRIGLSVCYDAAFPEHARAAASAGADAYVCPSAYPAGGGQQRRRIYLQARALENTMYVISADVAGGLAFGPDGMERDPDRLILDRPTLEETRSRLTMLDDRV
jgi:predicted amidohydrolase